MRIQAQPSLFSRHGSPRDAPGEHAFSPVAGPRRSGHRTQGSHHDHAGGGHTVGPSSSIGGQARFQGRSPELGRGSDHDLVGLLVAKAPKKPLPVLAAVEVPALFRGKTLDLCASLLQAGRPLVGGAVQGSLQVLLLLGGARNEVVDLCLGEAASPPHGWHMHW